MKTDKGEGIPSSFYLTLNIENSIIIVERFTAVIFVKMCKRLISLLMAVSLITACFGASFNASSYDGSNDDDYKAMISYFRQQMKARNEDISYTFVTSDSSYVDSYNDTNVTDLGNAFYNTVFFDIFRMDIGADAQDPYLSDYLYNSVSSAAVVDRSYTTTQNEGAVQYTFGVEFKFTYYSTLSDEEYISSFVENFSQEYIDSNMTDYQKVKTIYDFVVRNVTYDYDVFHNRYPLDSERYLHSHSAYGAICGNLIAKGQSENDVALEYGTVLSGEKIAKNPNQGLSVCEGYSKLFYALCVYNGIPCRIVDGDNSANSGKESDPHEWNFVYLDDGVKTDGARWYQVDTTFASQYSIKEIDMNSYDFFLKGSLSDSFDESKHQLPYADFGTGGEITVKEQLYDWYADENKSSPEDYEIPITVFTSAAEEASHGFIIRRTTDFGVGKGEQIAYIYTDLQKSFLIAVDEKRNVIMEEVEGFNFTGIDSTFDVLLPYLIEGREYTVGDGSGNAGVLGNPVKNYSINIYGADNSSVSIPFKIVPMDMSNSADNYSERDIQESAPYTGSVIVPEVYLIDGYENELEEGRDYDVNYYTDESKTTPAELKRMGTYWCDIQFKGNYCGEYLFSFNIGKADLSNLTHSNIVWTYIPAPQRVKNGYSTPADLYIAKRAANLNIGGMKIENGVDYTVSCNGGWGAQGGTLTLTGVNTSEKVKGGTKTSFSYSFEPLDISYLDGSAYDTGTYYYSGSEIAPTGSDALDSILESGVDYRVVDYSNNINAGYAKVKIRGIGNCTGEAELKYYIRPLSIGGIKLENLSYNNGVLGYTVKYGNTVLKKGVDYTEKIEKSTTAIKLTLTGTGNYNSTCTINIPISQNSPTPVPSSVPTVNKSAVSKLVAKKKAIVVYWKKVKGNVTGYRIEYSLKSNFKSAKTINVKGASKTSYTIKKLKSKKVYYVRIRTYYKKGNVIYLSKWSKSKKVRVK